MVFVINHNDVKPFSEVIKIETEFLTSECVEKGYPIFFRSTRFDNVKVLEESKVCFAFFLNLLHYGSSSRINRSNFFMAHNFRVGDYQKTLKAVS